MNERYKNPDNDPKGLWKSSDCLVKTYMVSYDYPIVTPNGKIINPPKGRYWMTSKENFQKLIDDNRIWFGENGSNTPLLKRFLSEVKQGITPLMIWKYSDVEHNQDVMREILTLFNDKIFDTPKLERLSKRIIEIGTKTEVSLRDFGSFGERGEGSLVSLNDQAPSEQSVKIAKEITPTNVVLDFFAGSGTTIATAHKLGRKWLGVEMGEHFYKVVIPRMKKAISGFVSGISKEVEFKGDGSFSTMSLRA